MQNFKSFEDFKIDFDDINVLVGINNAGKSTILLAIKACFNFIAQLIKEKDKLDSKSSRTAVDISYLNLPNIKDAWHNKRQRTSKAKIIPVIFTIEFTNNIILEIHLNQYYGQPHIRIQNLQNPIPSKTITEILESMPILVPGFVGALVQEELRTFQSVNRIMSAGRHTEVLRNVILQLRNEQPERFKILNTFVEKYFGVKLSKIQFNERIDEFVTAEFKDHDTSLDVVLAGSGFLQILQLLTFILIKRSNIVLLDEPDAHLHPSLQKILIEILTELGKQENIQFIVSTHSKEIVSQTDPKKIIFIDNKDKEGRRLSSVPEMMDVLGKLGSIDHIDLALLLKTKRCLFVEGDDFKPLHVFANILGINAFQGNKQVIPIRRNGEANTRYYDDLTVFRNFIGSDLKAYSIIDRDVKTEDRVNEIIRKSNEKFVTTHVWTKHELENYLIIPSLIERVLNEKLAKSGNGHSMNNVNELLLQCADELKQSLEDRISQELIHWERANQRNLDVVAANQKAREIVSSKWSNTQEKLSIVPGKDLLKRLNEKMQEKHGISTSVMELVSQIKKEEIPDEIISVLREIESI